MAYLQQSTNWINDSPFILTQRTGTTVTFSTTGQYVDRNIALTIDVAEAVSDANEASVTMDISTTSVYNGSTNIYSCIGAKGVGEPVSGYYIAIDGAGAGNSQITSSGWINAGTLGTATATLTNYFPIAAATGTLSLSCSGNLSITPQNANNIIVASSNSYNNNLLLNPSINATITGTCLATTAGYMPNGATISNEVPINNINKSGVYLQGVVLNAPASGESKFSITVPNDDEQITFVFHVKSNGEVIVNDSYGDI